MSSVVSSRQCDNKHSLVLIVDFNSVIMTTDFNHDFSGFIVGHCHSNNSVFTGNYIFRSCHYTGNFGCMFVYIEECVVGCLEVVVVFSHTCCDIIFFSNCSVVAVFAVCTLIYNFTVYTNH